MAPLGWPTEGLIAEKFDAYVSAVGKVAHAWNSLQESLGNLFTMMLPLSSHHVVLAVWFSQNNDRSQRNMLRAAILGGALKTFDALPVNAHEDLVWLLDLADKLGVRRDQAVHTPCALITNAEGTEMAAAFFSGNPFAKQLEGKRLLEEFAVSEWRATLLTYYVREIVKALKYDISSWPEKRPLLTRELRPPT